MAKMVLPAGKYFVGDPCYVFSNGPDGTDNWDKVGEITGGFENFGVVHEMNGHPWFAAGTWYGDGTYKDQFGNEYGVDAGLIGAMPEALWEVDEDELKGLGYIAVFKEPFTVGGGRENGTSTIEIGYHFIETGEEDGDEEDDYWDETGHEDD